ncbi:MAG: 30S ribosomal protein S16 [Bacteroidales bacterium]|jgi:small subunit ribosomal protein S16|nr:30S ribosomal protein S16 [Bacteroidales bacterium]MCK9497904.1 30S ribosomal protein S16 [Bacteroidales bacterium]MDY0313904.1 30S ribosomal protein S16 [Bacteroidales bacterium]NLB86049.1 30S ribosomal protein S16 [Bacteroidales bacterium]
MAVKLRLARHGRKRQAYYHIVAADSRAPRDGKYIERIGSYNPVSNPAKIELDFDKALTWIMNGAQPSDTVRRILSYKGVLMKKHLLDGIKKGAFDEAEAERRFQVWLKEKEAKITSKVSDLELAKREADKERLEAERKIKEQKAEAIAKKFADEAAEAKAAEDAKKASEEVEETKAEVNSEKETPEASSEETVEPSKE